VHEGRSDVGASELDVAGVGLGPCNLSLAALLAPVPGVRARFLEARSSFLWHYGMMVPGAQVQVSFLKDLVTLVDPCNPFSFLNYLATEGHLHRFIVAHTDRCSRQEFERYYQWAAGRLDSVRFDHAVEEVDVVGGAFEVRFAGRPPVTARNLVIGSGRTPFVPEFARGLLGTEVLHSSEYRIVAPQLADRDVMVVGAGQSGAEVVNHLLSGVDGAPRSLTWVSSRVGFLPMDDSPFSNEWFQPAYVDHFHGLSADRRRRLLEQQRLASDGVSESLLQEIYRRLYELDVLTPGRLEHRLLPCRRVVQLRREDGRLTAVLRDDDADGETETHRTDVVVFATGYRSEFPAYLEPLRERLVGPSGTAQVRRDYSLEWDGPAHLGVYVQNSAEASHGIADPNLSLASWRSARIANAICGRPVYRTEDAHSTISWDGGVKADPPSTADRIEVTLP
jgi:lysine N6-hydroxylase